MGDGVLEQRGSRCRDARTQYIAGYSQQDACFLSARGKISKRLIVEPWAGPLSWTAS